MSNKYKLPIAILTILLLLTIGIGTSYSLYKINQTEDNFIVYQNDCLEILTQNEIISKENLEIYSDDNGRITLPYSMVITNTCNNNEQLELRLNLLQGNTVNRQELKVFINGDFHLEPTLYSSLINSASNKLTTNLYSKILGSLEIPSHETKRINLRFWIDDTKNTSDTQNLIAKLEFSNSETTFKPIFKETILTNNKNILSTNIIDFSSVEEEKAILSSTYDNDGISYYFRGPVTTNYVSFANYLWRIIRINGDGTIRLILDNPTYDNTTYNKLANDNKYLTLSYQEEEEEKSTTINDYLTNWYQEHLSTYDEFIASTNYCNDTSFDDNLGTIFFGAYNRINNNTPSLKCPPSRLNYGGLIEKKIGLITADEVSFAGGTKSSYNQNYYLYSDYYYFTMSPNRNYYSNAYIMIVNEGSLKELSLNQIAAVRPVINIESGLTVSGSGTITNPYTIDKPEAD